ncbi:hypothetical protein ACIRQY_29095 [Streptomyces sp. NPDC101490]|uniref:hypothetical protein n=1 Tax=Streptomyces sp. NPDC101490 TaxID=3366143 RepID=UPI003828D950
MTTPTTPPSARTGRLTVTAADGTRTTVACQVTAVVLNPEAAPLAVAAAPVSPTQVDGE